MFKESELKVQLVTGHEFYKKTKILLITFAHGLEYVGNCYVVDKLTTPIILGIQWL